MNANISSHLSLLTSLLALKSNMSYFNIAVRRFWKLSKYKNVPMSLPKLPLCTISHAPLFLFTLFHTSVLVSFYKSPPASWIPSPLPPSAFISCTFSLLLLLSSDPSFLSSLQPSPHRSLSNGWSLFWVAIFCLVVDPREHEYLWLIHSRHPPSPRPCGGGNTWWWHMARQLLQSKPGICAEGEYEERMDQWGERAKDTRQKQIKRANMRSYWRVRRTKVYDGVFFFYLETL